MCLPRAPKIPTPPAAVAPPPPPPAPADKAMRDAGKRTRQQASLAQGRGATILTSRQGVLDQANTNKKTLLGA